MTGSEGQQKDIYLFPGQGADERLFSRLKFKGHYKLHHIYYPVPLKSESLRTYSTRFVKQIKDPEKSILIGVSLGGMICTELADLVRPEKVIIISSAKANSELPGKYMVFKTIKINRVLSGNLLKTGALFLAPLVEKERKNEKKLCNDMLREKDPVYMKRSIDMIINWDRKVFAPSIIHIHGSNDHTIPLKKVNANFIVEHGSHMMVLTQSEEVNHILSRLLE